MSSDTIKKIAEYKSRLATLEAELYAELATLPGRYGFESADEFIAALRKASAGKPARKAGPRAKKAVAGKKRRKARAVITPETETAVKQLVEAGKTGAEIAKELGVSVPSVHNIKKKLGLVKARKA